MIIQMENICKKYGNNEVIKGLNLQIEDRKFTTLLGPSGCGKTTILRMIAGLEAPTSGEIWFDDSCVFSDKKKINVPPEKRKLGFVFQDFALWPHMTVMENVAFGLKARKDTRDMEKRVLEALKAVQLWDFRDRYPAQLSGGQQQRVGFARAIVTSPDCILFDEPLSALDAILREEMRSEIKNLTEKMEITSVFVTHDQMEAMSMSDQIVVLNQGRIEQKGRPEEIYRRPKTCFTAKFIGKSNWLGENVMFRPEAASLVRQPGFKEFTVKVRAVQFLGEKYQLFLDRTGEAPWILETSEQYEIGSSLSVFINEDKIIKFQEA